jgi:nitrous oxidase accessory protein NosD
MRCCIRNLMLSIVLVTALAAGGTIDAATCNVPSVSYPTIQTAVDVATCDPIVVAGGSYLEELVIDRSLTLQGAGSGSSFIQGGVEVQAGTVTINGFHLSGTGEALWSHTGAEVSGFDLQVVNGIIETPFFADGFESGTAGEWSTVVP